jgi:geranylgeranyl diphosphate synthase type I
MMFEEILNVDYNDYLKMIYLKTSALLEASAKLGALAAYAVDLEEEIGFDTIELAGQYGKFVGLAFQIRDDILGVFGDPKKTGKPVYNDLRRGKKTILVLYAYQNTEGKEKELLEKVLKREVTSDSELEKIAEIIEKSGALAYAMNLAETLSNNAISVLEELPVQDKKGKDALIELAKFVVQREK